MVPGEHRTKRRCEPLPAAESQSGADVEGAGIGHRTRAFGLLMFAAWTARMMNDPACIRVAVIQDEVVPVVVDGLEGGCVVF